MRAVAASLTVLILVLSACTDEVRIDAGDASRGPAVVSAVRPEQIVEEPAIESFGSLAFIRSNTVTAEVGGTVELLLVDMGDEVASGQVLAELENVQLEIRGTQTLAQLQQARASVELAQAQLREAERATEARQLGLERTTIQLEQRRRELQDISETLEEQRSLREVDGVSQEAVEATELEFFSRQSSVASLELQLAIDQIGFRDRDAREYLGREPRDEQERARAIVLLNTQTPRAQLSNAQAQLSLAQAELESVRELRRQLTILSPTDGVIANRAVEAGDTVAEATGLFTVIGEEPSLYAVVSLPERQAPLVRQGQPATVSVPALEEAEFPATVAILSPLLDPQTGNRVIRVQLPASDPRLLPGLFARVRIPTDEPRTVATLPSSALRSRNNNEAVVLVVQNGRVFETTIEVRDPAGVADRIVVEGGLEIDALVVNRPSEVLRDGTEVEVREE